MEEKLSIELIKQMIEKFGEEAVIEALSEEEDEECSPT